ncbi:M57 family metalloprotease [Ekhidna sp.]|uniref:M57 family metalloprotease n=1 Tax=Ekhidna sp. TaxID=2608089 RepID=UPI003CCBBF07
MRRINNILSLALIASITLFSCSEQEPVVEDFSAPDDVVAQIAALGFDVENFPVETFENGYLVERDIYLTDATIAEMGRGNAVPSVEQYRTNNLVNAGGGRVITIYAPEEGSGGGGGKGKKGGGGSGGYSPAMIAGLDEAISRYNAENLTISFQRVTNSSGADIVMTRLSKRDERRGVLGSAGFPTNSGDPYGEIKMSGVLESSYGLSTNGIATIIAHEMGHCIGFRHTDYFDRSISCGGGTSNEGDGGVGAIHIPGTPTGASLSKQSWMLACTDGSNRDFNNDDKTALDYLY